MPVGASNREPTAAALVSPSLALLRTWLERIFIPSVIFSPRLSLFVTQVLSLSIFLTVVLWCCSIRFFFQSFLFGSEEHLLFSWPTLPVCVLSPLTSRGKLTVGVPFSLQTFTLTSGLSSQLQFFSIPSWSLTAVETPLFSHFALWASSRTLLL